MKKIHILLAVGLALVVSSCEKKMPNVDKPNKTEQDDSKDNTDQNTDDKNDPDNKDNTDDKDNKDDKDQSDNNNDKDNSDDKKDKDDDKNSDDKDDDKGKDKGYKVVFDENRFAKPESGMLIFEKYGEAEINSIMETLDPNDLKKRGNLRITDEQYNYIKEFTEKEILSKDKDKSPFKRTFDWINKNIKHENSSNDPYDVLKNRKGICYGFSNLTKTMMLIEDTPCIVVTGKIYGEDSQAHSWNFCYVDNKWKVVDALNNWIYDLKDFAANQWRLTPFIIDEVFWSNYDFDFTYDRGLNISKIKSKSEILSIPYSMNGFRITAFKPYSEIPSNIKELYLGENILYLGGEINNATQRLELKSGLISYDKSLVAIHVSKNNPKFESYKYVLYERGRVEPLYIPKMITRLELRPIENVDKNLVVGKPELEEIVFADGTKNIGDYAIEDCPKLKTAIVPKGTKVSDRAFDKVANDFKIIYR